MELSGGVCNASLCQHPECWKASVQKVKEAVRMRNGIKFKTSATANSGFSDVLLRKKRDIESSDGTYADLIAFQLIVCAIFVYDLYFCLNSYIIVPTLPNCCRH